MEIKIPGARKLRERKDRGDPISVRHASRTHRVALDWLFDRINLDPKIQTRYIDNKHQLADILTKWNITRDELAHIAAFRTPA